MTPHGVTFCRSVEHDTGIAPERSPVEQPRRCLPSVHQISFGPPRPTQAAVSEELASAARPDPPKISQIPPTFPEPFL